LGVRAGGRAAQTPRENYEVQKFCGVDIVLWLPEEVEDAVPHLDVEDIALASCGGPGEARASSTTLA